MDKQGMSLRCKLRTQMGGPTVAWQEKWGNHGDSLKIEKVARHNDKGPSKNS